jgi:hypothetical protein
MGETVTGKEPACPTVGIVTAWLLVWGPVAIVGTLSNFRTS